MRKRQVGKKDDLQDLERRVAALEHDVALLTLGDQLRQAIRRIAALEAK